MRRKVFLSLSLPYIGAGPSTVAVGLADGFRSTTLDPTLFVYRATVPLPSGLSVVRPLPAELPSRIADRPQVAAWLLDRIGRKLLRAVEQEGPGALVWLLPDLPIGLLRALKARDAILVREMINTPRPVAQAIVETEHARLGLKSRYPITDALVRAEREELDCMDYLVSPSAAVDDALVRCGYASDRIIRTTFGWKPGDLADQPRIDLLGKGSKAIFVASVDLRKGVHLALEAWTRAETGGSLIIVGRVDPVVQPILDRYLTRGDIHLLPFTDKLGSVYRSADYMILPTLEEGAPLVCYQAAGCGLPILTSPMGQARIIVDGESGLVVDPHDGAALVAAIQRMAKEPELRQRLAIEAKRRADSLTWADVAADRAQAIAALLKRDGR